MLGNKDRKIAMDIVICTSYILMLLYRLLGLFLLCQ